MFRSVFKTCQRNTFFQTQFTSKREYASFSTPLIRKRAKRTLAACLATSAYLFSSFLWCYSDNSTNVKPNRADPYPRAPIANIGSVLPVPKKGKLVFVGDVHGCYDELIALLQKVQFNPEAGDFLVLVGDLIGKGPNSRKVLQLAMSFGSQCAIIRGNHEQVIIDWKWKIDSENGEVNENLRSTMKILGTSVESSPPQQCHSDSGHGTSCHKASFMEMSSEVQTHRDCAMEMTEEEWCYLLRAPLWLHFPEINVLSVHAGILPFIPVEQQNPRELMNVRSVVPLQPLAHSVLPSDKSFCDKQSLLTMSENLSDVLGINDFIAASNKIDPQGSLWAAAYSQFSILLRSKLDPDSASGNLETSFSSKDTTSSPAPTGSMMSVPIQGVLSSLPHIIFGHDAKSAVQIHSNATGLDSGCCYGRHLTALVFEDPGQKILDMKVRDGVPKNVSYFPPILERESIVDADVMKESSCHFLNPYFVQVEAHQQYKPVHNQS